MSTRPYVLLKITGFSDFVHRPVFWKLENTTFQKLDLRMSTNACLRKFSGFFYALVIMHLVLFARFVA
jgi:hypothetical protein